METTSAPTASATTGASPVPSANPGAQLPRQGGQPRRPLTPPSGDSLSAAANAALRGAQGGDGTADATPDGAEGPGDGDTPDGMPDEGTQGDGQETGEQGDSDPDAGLHEVTINGKKEKVTLAELKRGYGHNKVATQKLQEAARIREQNQRFSGIFENIRNNPAHFWELGSALGIDVDSIAATRVLEAMRRESLTPEQRELEDLRKWKQEGDSEREQSEAERQRQEAAQQEVANLERVGNDYATYFESKGVTPTLEFQERMLSYLVASYSRPEGPMSMADAFARAQRWDERQKSSRWENLSDEDLKRLPPHVRQKFRQADVASMKRPGAAQRAPAQPTPPLAVPDKPMTTSEAFDQMRQQLIQRQKR